MKPISWKTFKSFSRYIRSSVKIQTLLSRKKMSARKEPADSENNGQGRIVTDSVHERLRQPSVYCPTCRENIPASDTEIEKHFTASHVSETKCLYCQGKVFNYLSFHIDEDGNKISKDETYHSCRLAK